MTYEENCIPRGAASAFGLHNSDDTHRSARRLALRRQRGVQHAAKENGNAEVFAGGQIYNLPGVQAGSGNRYTNGSVEYWEHGNEAMLNGAAGGPYNNCRRG